jgi:hypothetical protein
MYYSSSKMLGHSDIHLNGCEDNEGVQDRKEDQDSLLRKTWDADGRHPREDYHGVEVLGASD